MKQVRERTKSSAWVVLNEKGEYVAKVQCLRADSGTVQVDVWSREPGQKFLSLTHQARATGGGYNKFSAALAGAVIEGHEMLDGGDGDLGSLEARGFTVIRAL